MKNGGCATCILPDVLPSGNESSEMSCIRISIRITILIGARESITSENQSTDKRETLTSVNNKDEVIEIKCLY
jgi:hypothetical protein